jgi:hypothetical protein
MKKQGYLIAILVFITISVYAQTIKTGDSISYFPKGAPQVSSKRGDSSKCFVTKIAKANGYPEGTFELQLTSCDWLGSSVFPITFTYIIKKNDTIKLVEMTSIYGGSESVEFTVKNISDNTMELEKQPDTKGTITPSEDSL